MIYGKLAGLYFSCILLQLFMAGSVSGQDKTPPSEQKPNRLRWPDGKQAAISLSFDDARPSQIDLGIPLLDRYGVKATFYISPDNLKKRSGDWKRAVEKGHEVGNHTMSHPCTGNYSFSREKALETYTLETMATEIDEANRFIQRTLGQMPTTFAYPCGQTFVGRGKETKSYVPLVATHFETGRLWLSEDSNDPDFCDRAQLLAMEIDGKSFDQLLPAIQKAKGEGRWLILAGHEMAGSGPQTTSLETLEALCRYTRAAENKLWIETVGNVARYILDQRNQSR